MYVKLKLKKKHFVHRTFFDLSIENVREINLREKAYFGGDLKTIVLHDYAN